MSLLHYEILLKSLNMDILRNATYETILDSYNNRTSSDYIELDFLTYPIRVWLPIGLNGIYIYDESEPTYVIIEDQYVNIEGLDRQYSKSFVGLVLCELGRVINGSNQ
jgi:hypothetical protein